MPAIVVILAAAVSTATLASCGKSGSARPESPSETLATVNGVPITAQDLDQRLRKIAAAGAGVHEVSGNVLNTIVRDELIYQESVRLGLDANPEYRLKLGELEAQLRAFKRQELSSLFRAHVQEAAAVTDAEAREYFDENAKEIQTRFHVLQILYRGKHEEIARAREDLRSGIPFETVAGRRFPGAAADARAPWDLGELRWQQLPDPWKGIVDRLEPGQVSEIIKGEGERYWLVKLVKKTVDPGITFATERERIVEILRQRRASELWDGKLTELRAKARITYSK